ncbi:MAG TPA: formylglycine-generating enzyme family protein [Pirellulales bacterium]|nr:formylglycine-generating enzyme family protein [Pirellulales bacterium]
MRYRLPIMLCALLLAVPGSAMAAETVTNSIGMKLVLVPGGEFMMGASEDLAKSMARFPYAKASWFSDETPRHHVRINRGFYMGAYEVTLGQFLTFYHAAHYKLDSERDGKPNWGYGARHRLVRSPGFVPWSPDWQIGFNEPVVYVSWNDATAFCQWLSEKEGKTYRLPTEAEWEYACRAGTTTVFYNGNDPERLPAVGNVADGTARDHWPNATSVSITDKDRKRNSKALFAYLTARDGYVYAAPVGRFRPNLFGLYDMHGNVAEWCSDYYHSKYYSESPEDDPRGPESGNRHVLRGGAWSNEAAIARSSHRATARADRRSHGWGFRVVCELPLIHVDTDGLNLQL